MAQTKEGIYWHQYVAVSTALIAVLAAIASFRSGTDASLMLLSKNSANLYQNQANKEWNTYLAQEILSLHQDTSRASIETQKQEKIDLQQRTGELEKKVTMASDKAQLYFEKNSKLTTAGTFLEIAIALSAMSILIKKRYFWIFSLFLAAIGIYFLILGLI